MVLICQKTKDTYKMNSERIKELAMLMKENEKEAKQLSKIISDKATPKTIKSKMFIELEDNRTQYDILQTEFHKLLTPLLNILFN